MPYAFFAPIIQHFAPMFRTYGFSVAAEQYDPEGPALLRLASERYFLDFVVDGVGPELRLAVGRHGQPAADVAWIFAALTRTRVPVAPEAAGLTAPGLYFYPHLALNLWGAESVAWQAARLADVLQPLWAGIWIYLDMDGPRSVEFAALRKRIEREAEERAADAYSLSTGSRRLPASGSRLLPDDEAFQHVFAPPAQKSFSFLAAYGFGCTYAAPRVVRFETSQDQGRLGADAGVPPLYITIFHRTRSGALGVHTGSVAGSREAELNFDMEELAAWSGLRYTPEVVRRDEELPAALNRLSRLYRQFAAPVLGGDTRLLVALLTRRIDAAHRASRAWAERNRGL